MSDQQPRRITPGLLLFKLRQAAAQLPLLQPALFLQLSAHVAWKEA